MITELTPEQDAMLDKVADEYTLLLLADGPSDRPEAEAALREAMKSAGVPFEGKPIFWALDPIEAAQQAKKFFGAKFFLDLFHQAAVHRKYVGYWLSRLVGFYDRVLGPTNPELRCPELYGLDRLIRQVEIAYVFEEAAFLVERAKCVFGPPEDPNEPFLRDLHNPDGPSYSFPSGKLNLYDIRGVAVTQEIVEGRFTARDIVNQPNAEVRRVMLEKYGAGKFLHDIGAKAEHQDLRGTLFRAPMAGDEDLVMIRYINRSPEPGMAECPHCKGVSKRGIEFGATSRSLKRVFLTGNFCECGGFVIVDGAVHKVYWHRVAPTCRTATDAYVWMKPRLRALVEAGFSWEIVEES